MKKLLFISLLFPIVSFAQIHFKDSTFKATESVKLAYPLYSSTTHPFLIGHTVYNPLVKVVDENHKEIATVDSCYNLHVFGDSATVIKTLIRLYGIKIN
jgi:hypothetical protein